MLPRRIAAALLALPLAVLLGLGAAPPAAAEAPLTISVSILPLADFTRQVGGDAVEVHVLVPPGADVHAYDLRPSQMQTLQRSRLLILNGLGLEPFGGKLRALLARRRIPVLEVGTGLAPGADPEPAHEEESEGEHEHGHGDEDGHGHGHGGVDPHVWLDPQLAILQVARIRDALSALAPAQADAFTRRAANYMQALLALDGQYRAALRGAPVRRFIAYHGGYGHLAARYGLEQIPVLQGDSLGGPSVARVAQIIALARREGLGTIFAEPQFSRRAVTTLAREAGLRVSTLDALGTTPDSTYIAMMTRNLEHLREALFPPSARQ